MALDENALVDWPTVRDRLSLSDSDQTYVESLVNTVCAEANRISGRKLAARDITETIDTNGTDVLKLGEFPVNNVTAVYFDPTRNFGAETELKSYYLDAESGLIITDTSLPACRRCVRIEYNAGYQTAEKDLENAVIEGVKWMLSRYRSEAIGIRSQTTPDGTEMTLELTLPMSAQRAFEGYRDPRIG